ncbi:MAG: ABC transporter permease subunit [Proteobacteria bacterium]|nr:ABC transporter permease subunit [Pseudomonadota bacterium]
MNAAVLPATRDPALGPRLGLTLLGLLLLWPAIQLSEFDPRKLVDPQNLVVMGRFLSTFLPPETAPDFLSLVLRSTLETLALATAGMALAVLVGLPLAMLVSESLSVSRIGPARRAWLGLLARLPVRGLLIFMRSVPEIVWALLFVRAVGLGPAAGVLAIALSYAGMLGKVYFEIFESGDTRPARALLESGSGRVHAFVYGIVPVALPELLSYTVYRWECAIRASVVMGFVGAGGLGQQMELSMRMLAGGEVATMLLAFFLLVMLADGVSALLRKVLI